MLLAARAPFFVGSGGYFKWRKHFLVLQSMLPRRVCRSWLSEMPVQHARAPEQAQETISPRKKMSQGSLQLETYQLSH